MMFTGSVPASRAAIGGALLGLVACGPSAQPTRAVTTNEASTGQDHSTTISASMALTDVSAAHAPPSGPLACGTEIGAAAAAQRAALCRNVSPATHPPCNVANSCAMIEDEIARSCALFDGRGDRVPACDLPPKGMKAAAAVVTRYYSAINARDYDTAWRQWGDDGPPNQTPDAFRAGFARTRSTRVTIGTLAPGDGGAGSVYQAVPVTVDATLDDGRHQRFRGEYVVRRVNDVDGASPEQLRWHIASAKLTVAR